MEIKFIEDKNQIKGVMICYAHPDDVKQFKESSEKRNTKEPHLFQGQIPYGFCNICGKQEEFH